MGNFFQIGSGISGQPSNNTGRNILHVKPKVALSVITATQETFGKVAMRVARMLSVFTSVGSVIRPCIGRVGRYKANQCLVSRQSNPLGGCK